ncbi:MAG TPA: hypothetical protein VGE53_00690 [Candidatus Paceibacterota bacterium]
MPTVIHTLDEDRGDMEFLTFRFQLPYLEGECYAFAIALNQGLGWPLVGLMKGDEIWHAGVRAPNGKIYDARGPLTEEAFGGHFMPPPHVIREVTEAELRATRPIADFSVQQARQFAEVNWPALPWQESLASRIEAFASDLEVLSRKHGFWIDGPVPASLPLIIPGEGDEGGYELRLTVDGMKYTINRYLLR